MQRPSIRLLQQRAPDLARAATGVALGLARGGHRGWVVGGAVRDLARGEVPGDCDMASAARPDEVEALFERTLAVGKAFGTLLVLDFGLEVQLTTFRAETGYSDGRHPDRVRYAETLEEDARRRDFTCNALYLDPLADEVADPEGGLADLAAGRLRCVGDPRERFAEDGLRLLRLARFAAGMGLGVEPDTLGAAEASLAALRGVSPERVYAELSSILEGPAAVRAVELLASTGVAERVLVGWRGAEAERLALLGRLGEEAGGLARWIALGGEQAPEMLEALRAPRALRDEVSAVLDLERRLGGPPATRAERIRLVREPRFDSLLELSRARGGAAARVAEELETLRAGLDPGELHPEPLLTAADLEASGLPRGPRWGQVLRAAEALQLEGRLSTRAQALAWLRDQAAEPAGD